MNLSQIDIASLSLFAHVARAESITQGAELANMTFSAASARIKRMEEITGAQLFDRQHSRGVALTEAGRLFFSHAQRLLSESEHLASSLAAHARGTASAVRLWVDTAGMTEALPGWIADFQVANPGVRLEFEERDSEETVAGLVAGTTDVGIFDDRVVTPGVKVQTYWQERLVLMVPKRHPLAGHSDISFEDAMGCEFIGLSGSSASKRLRTTLGAYGRHLRMPIQVRSFDAMCRMVAAGLGVALLPYDVAQAFVRLAGIKQVMIWGRWPDRRLLIGTQDGSNSSGYVKSLVEHLLKARQSQPHKRK